MAGSALVSEKEVEDFLDACAKARDGLTRKVVYPNRRGAKDRMLVLPFIGVTLCEIKRPVGGVYSIHQKREHEALAAAGAPVQDFSTKAAIAEFFMHYDSDWYL